MPELTYLRIYLTIRNCDMQDDFEYKKRVFQGGKPAKNARIKTKTTHGFTTRIPVCCKNSSSNKSLQFIYHRPIISVCELRCGLLCNARESLRLCSRINIRSSWRCNNHNPRRPSGINPDIVVPPRGTGE